MSEFDNIKDREIQMRSNGTHVQTEPYSRQAMQRLKRNVELFFNQGNHKYYSIAVDGETVVSRTYDARKFDDYLPFIEPGVKTIEVKMFQGNSPNCNRYMFVMQAQLSGVRGAEDLERRYQDANRIDNLQRDLQAARDEIAKRKKKLRRIKREFEKLWFQFEDFKQEAKESAPARTQKILGDIVSLAGILGFGSKKNSAELSGTPQSQETNTTQVEVELETDSKTSNKGSEHKKILEDLETSYGKDGLDQALFIATVMAASPELQEKFKKHISKIKQ